MTTCPFAPLAFLTPLALIGCAAIASPPVTPGAPSSPPSAEGSPSYPYTPQPSAPMFVAYNYASRPSTPEPNPSPLLPQVGSNGVTFSPDNPVVVEVGGTVSLRASHSYGSPAPFTWGVFESDRARIDSEGRLTASVPGPVHAYTERDGKRSYCAIAAVSAQRVWTDLDAPEFYGGSTTWGTYLQSDADWDAYVRSMPETLRTPVPRPPVEFSNHTILAVRAGTANIGDVDSIELTDVVEGARPTYRLSLTNHGREIVAPATSNVGRLFVLPKRTGDATLEIAYPFKRPYTTGLSPVTGPTPITSPTPPPTPSPVLNSPPPFALPTPDEEDCAPRTAWSPGTRLLELAWDRPKVGPAGWEPVLKVGSSLHLVAVSQNGPVTWYVADPQIATVDADGWVTALQEGPIEVIAASGQARARAIVAAVGLPNSLTRLNFGVYSDMPPVGTPEGATLLTTQAQYQEFQRTALANPMPPDKWPEVDFESHSLVVVVRDRTSRNEAIPVITSIDRTGGTIDLVYPGVEGPGELNHDRRTFVFAIRKITPSAQIREYSLCRPRR